MKTFVTRHAGIIRFIETYMYKHPWSKPSTKSQLLLNISNCNVDV